MTPQERRDYHAWIETLSVEEVLEARRFGLSGVPPWYNGGERELSVYKWFEKRYCQLDAGGTENSKKVGWEMKKKKLTYDRIMPRWEGLFLPEERKKIHPTTALALQGCQEKFPAQISERGANTRSEAFITLTTYLYFGLTNGLISSVGFFHALDNVFDVFYRSPAPKGDKRSIIM